MHLELVEYALTCPEHGTHRTVIPAGHPLPRRCVHCFSLLNGRRELRRFQASGPVPGVPQPEAWVG